MRVRSIILLCACLCDECARGSCVLAVLCGRKHDFSTILAASFLHWPEHEWIRAGFRRDLDGIYGVCGRGSFLLARFWHGFFNYGFSTVLAASFPLLANALAGRRGGMGMEPAYPVVPLTHLCEDGQVLLFNAR